MPSTKPPSGTRDYLPEAVAKRRYVVGRIEDVFQHYSFQPRETPAIENLSALLGKYGEEGDQLLFRLLHRGDKLARALANEAPKTGDLAELGLRYDLTGTASLLTEGEVMNAVSAALLALGVTNFSRSLNHRVILRSLIQAAGIVPTLEGSALTALDKLDKSGADGYAKNLPAAAEAYHLHSDC